MTFGAEIATILVIRTLRNGTVDVAKKGAADERGIREESLVPMIEEEEHRLAALLEEARAQAERIVEYAGREANQRIASVEERLPGLKEERNTRARAAIEKEADELRKEASAALDALRADAEANREAAVRAVVEAVWPHPL